MSIPELFEQTITDTITKLPDQYKEQLDNVAITIQDRPTLWDYLSINAHPRSLLFGTYRGIPKTHRNIYYSALPDKITIFIRPILAVSRNIDDLKRRIKKTLLHEIGHHFGLSDEQLRRVERN